MLPITSQSAWKPHGHPDGCAYDVIIIARPQVFDAWQEVVKSRCPQVGACGSRPDAALLGVSTGAASLDGSVHAGVLQLWYSCNQCTQIRAEISAHSTTLGPQHDPARV